MYVESTLENRIKQTSNTVLECQHKFAQNLHGMYFIEIGTFNYAWKKSLKSDSWGVNDSVYKMAAFASMVLLQNFQDSQPYQYTNFYQFL